MLRSMNKKTRVAIIGSGFGGLAAAIRLQAAGFPTTVFERRDKAGGLAHVVRDQGFTFDAGPAVLTAPFVIEELFQAANRPMNSYVELLPVQPLIRMFWENGFSFEISNDPRKIEQQIEKIAPSDVGGYRKFLAFSKKAFDQYDRKMCAEPFQDPWSMVRAAPRLLRLTAYRSAREVIDSFISDPRLREALAFPSKLMGADPSNAPALHASRHFLETHSGIVFPKGGINALVRGLVQLFTDLGGSLRVNADIESIVAKDGKVMGVQLTTGERQAFEVVVSNADVTHTYTQLLKKNRVARKVSQKVSKMTYGSSALVVCFGTSKKYSNVAQHNVIFGPSPYYLHVPTVTDLSLAPANGETFCALAMVPNLEKFNVFWPEEGPRFAEKMLDFIEQQCLPGLKKNIVTRKIFTPIDFESEFRTTFGSAFSIEPTLQQSFYFRPHNRDTNIHGLYLVGAGTHPGPGVANVMNSAKVTAKLIVDDFGPDRFGFTGEGVTIPAELAPEPG